LVLEKKFKFRFQFLKSDPVMVPGNLVCGQLPVNPQFRKIQKNKKERMEERKRRDFFVFTNLEVPILVCSPSVSQEHPWATALVQPSLRRTHLYGNLSYNNVIVGSNGR